MKLLWKTYELENTAPRVINIRGTKRGDRIDITNYYLRALHSPRAQNTVSPCSRPTTPLLDLRQQGGRPAVGGKQTDTLDGQY